MTIVTVPRVELPNSWLIDQNGASTSQLFDSGTDTRTAFCQIPEDGNIDNVHLRVTVSSTPVLVLNVSVQTVDLTTGLATGTNYKGHTTQTLANPTVGNKVFNVGIVGAAKGDTVAVVIAITAFVSGNIQIQSRIAGMMAPSTGFNFPYSISNTAGADVFGQLLGCVGFAFEYASNIYYPIYGFPGGALLCTPATATISANAVVTRRGNIWQYPLGVRARGIWANADLDGGTTLRIYTTSNALVAGATCTPSNSTRASTSGGPLYYMFDSGAAITINASTGVYTVAEATTNVSSTMYLLINIPDVKQLDMLFSQNNFAATYTASSSTWATNTSQCYGIGLIVDGFDIPASGGSAAAGLMRNPGLSGGALG